MTLLSTMAPIFGLLGLGFGAVKLRAIDDAGVRGLVLFVFNFAIPALLFRSLVRMELPEQIEWGFLIAFYVASIATYGLGMALGRFPFRRSLPEQAIFGMSSAYSNLVMMGIPIVLMALGPEASLPMLLIIAFHSATFMPLTVVLIQGGRGKGVRHLTPAFVEVLKNPIILGIVFGLLANLAGVTPWVGVDRVLELLGAAAVPCALFAVGASLASFAIGGEPMPTVALTTVKLVVHPLLVWVIAHYMLGLDGLWVSAAVVLAAMPTAVNAYLFGARYQVATEVAARTVLASTVCSMVTIGVVLALLPTGP